MNTFLLQWVRFTFVHQKSHPQVTNIQCFPHNLWKILGLVGAFFGGPLSSEKKIKLRWGIAKI